MSASKFIMAQKLHKVQLSLMGINLDFLNFEELLSTVFQECSKENLTFWFNFHEDYCALNLRDVANENYELNIRHAYVGVPLTQDVINEMKIYLLQDSFLLTEKSVKGISYSFKEVASSEEINILEGNKPVPKPIGKAIETIQAKGIPVTVDTIMNHLPLGQMSTSSRMECTKYLKEMEASQ